MEKEEKNISRRDALKRMSKAAVAVAVASVLPSMEAFSQKYLDRCYLDYTNYDNYTNHKDYYNYGNYRDYNNYHNYQNAAPTD